jgi:PilZ domain
MRNAVRFPLRLPVRVQLEDGGFIDAFTEDISATGVLFTMANAPEINTRLTWTLRMPADVMGAKEDVTVNCVGRVVWQRPAVEGRQVGVVIDDYRMGDGAHE